MQLAARGRTPGKLTANSAREYPAAVPNKYFAIDGIATYFHHLGPTTLPEELPDLSRGEALLYLHGAGGNGSFFLPLAEQLAERHSPIGFDFAGHARSGALDSLGALDKMAAFTHGVCERLGLVRPVLIGHSMGGAVGLRYALDRLGPIRALVLIGSFPHLELPEDRIELARRVVEGKARRQLGREAYSPQTPGEIVRKGIMEDLKTDPRVALGDMLACRDWDVRDQLGQIRVPTLVLTGEDELEVIAAASHQLVQGIPGARQSVIPKGGHMVHFEQPEPAAAAMLEFLDGLDA